jgi:hypothetical protein
LVKSWRTFQIEKIPDRKIPDQKFSRSEIFQMRIFQIEKIPDENFPDEKFSRSKYSRWVFFTKKVTNFKKVNFWKKNVNLWKLKVILL